jgi:hypothetical protein
MDLKRIVLPVHNKQINTVKESKSRVVTQANNWRIVSRDYDPDIQREMLTTDSSGNIVYETMKKQIQSKLHSYKSQDIRKELFSVNEFISLESTMEMLRNCNMTCFYCKCAVKVLYEQVREPSQWTLERIDNSRGHNTDNVEISCLSCNLKRRTMYHERFAFTKQLSINKLL